MHSPCGLKNVAFNATFNKLNDIINNSVEQGENASEPRMSHTSHPIITKGHKYDETLLCEITN